jgi:hypothetical protein
MRWRTAPAADGDEPFTASCAMGSYLAQQDRLHPRLTLGATPPEHGLPARALTHTPFPAASPCATDPLRGAARRPVEPTAESVYRCQRRGVATRPAGRAAESSGLRSLRTVRSGSIEKRRDLRTSGGSPLRGSRLFLFAVTRATASTRDSGASAPMERRPWNS